MILPGQMQLLVFVNNGHDVLASGARREILNGALRTNSVAEGALQIERSSDHVSLTGIHPPCVEEATSAFSRTGNAWSSV